MTLGEVIANLDRQPVDGILFVERIGGVFRTDSAVVVIELTDDELDRPVRLIAAERAPGKEYFLEVSVIHEILEGLGSSSGLRKFSEERTQEIIIYYAENDAYPDPL
jgi:hypothetical protein